MERYNDSIINFGKIKINKDKLYNKNILSIRNEKGKGIEGCNTCKVSGDFVNIINYYDDGCEITKEQYDELMLNIKPLVIGNLSQDSKPELYCDSSSCEIK